ncbi:hypothetical protein PR048_016536 [Dryococelus australis]|uniref:C2H2-type domain-containing protein n=1 Tax=Dryococelus australis TaxID=614101 RepID=A0ABQ9HL78_9NEOP|nr:hypothetical protein PR048_016536 [Dryococelus australis]
MRDSTNAATYEPHDSDAWTSLDLLCLRPYIFSYSTVQSTLHVYKTKKCCQEEVTKLWNAAKQRFPKKEDLVLHIQHEIEQLLREAAERKARTTLAFLNKGKTKTSNDASAQAGTSARSVQNVECAGAPKRKTPPLVVSNDEDEVKSNSTPSTMHPTPAQDIMKEKNAKLREELDLTERRKKYLVADGTEHEKARKLRREINGYEKKFKLKEKQRVKHRENKKQKIIELCSKNPDAVKSLTPCAGPGHPRLEEEQSELLKVVVDLAMFGASAEERCRCEIVRTVHTLSELTDKLIELGFNISRSATYIRLLPRWTDTCEAKRHVVTVPVKLSRPEADHHKAHQDQYFCDDKARVPIGLIVANKQVPLVMHVEYKVSLSDHDFVIASRHKLIPSMYVLYEVKSNEMGRPEAVSYSGPTYIAIRIDVSLEKDNFKKAGEILAEIWSAVCIDGHEVVAKYSDPNNDTSNVPDLPSEEWYAEHVRESQYLLQVVKCDDRDCCSPRRSSLHMILHDRLLSPPYLITQVDGHLTIPDPEEHDGKSFAPFSIHHCFLIQPLHAFIGMAYDLYCHSVCRDLEERCCSTCGIYFSSITRAAEHWRANDNGLEWLNQNEVEGADDFTENHMDMLVPVVTLETEPAGLSLINHPPPPTPSLHSLIVVEDLEWCQCYRRERWNSQKSILCGRNILDIQGLVDAVAIVVKVRDYWLFQRVSPMSLPPEHNIMTSRVPSSRWMTQPPSPRVVIDSVAWIPGHSSKGGLSWLPPSPLPDVTSGPLESATNRSSPRRRRSAAGKRFNGPGTRSDDELSNTREGPVVVLVTEASEVSEGSQFDPIPQPQLAARHLLQATTVYPHR